MSNWKLSASPAQVYERLKERPDIKDRPELIELLDSLFETHSGGVVLSNPRFMDWLVKQVKELIKAGLIALWDPSQVADDAIYLVNQINDAKAERKEVPNIFEIKFSEALEWAKNYQAEKHEDESRWDNPEHVYYFKGDQKGWTIDRLTTQKDLRTEGDLMGHCVGGDKYWKRHNYGQTDVFSLRDPRGLPHATFELLKKRFNHDEGGYEEHGGGSPNGTGEEEYAATDTEGDQYMVLQCFGKSDRPPVEEYRRMIGEFFKSQGITEESNRKTEQNFNPNTNDHEDYDYWEHQHGSGELPPTEIKDVVDLKDFYLSCDAVFNPGRYFYTEWIDEYCPYNDEDIPGGYFDLDHREDYGLTDDYTGSKTAECEGHTVYPRDFPVFNYESLISNIASSKVNIPKQVDYLKELFKVMSELENPEPLERPKASLPFNFTGLEEFIQEFIGAFNNAQLFEYDKERVATVFNNSILGYSEDFLPEGKWLSGEDQGQLFNHYQVPYYDDPHADPAVLPEDIYQIINSYSQEMLQDFLQEKKGFIGQPTESNFSQAILGKILTHYGLDHYENNWKEIPMAPFIYSHINDFVTKFIQDYPRPSEDQVMALIEPAVANMVENFEKDIPNRSYPLGLTTEIASKIDRTPEYRKLFPFNRRSDITFINDLGANLVRSEISKLQEKYKDHGFPEYAWPYDMRSKQSSWKISWDDMNDAPTAPECHDCGSPDVLFDGSHYQCNSCGKTQQISYIPEWNDTYQQLRDDPLGDYAADKGWVYFSHWKLASGQEDAENIYNYLRSINLDDRALYYYETRGIYGLRTFVVQEVLANRDISEIGQKDFGQILDIVDWDYLAELLQDQPYESAWKLADYQGWTNWDTWHTALLMDNEEKTYNLVREIVGKGGTPENLRDLLLRSTIGPYNAEEISNAKEWNSIPPEERIDYSYEDLKEKNPDAANLVNAFGIGPDVGDSQPTLIDPELVNWDEIWEGIRDEIQGDQKYEQDQKRLKEQGLDFGVAGHSDETNQMIDAWLKHHGITDPKLNYWDEGGENSQYGHRTFVPIDQLDPKDYNESYWDEKIVPQGGDQKSTKDIGWETLGDIQRGRATPEQIQTMQAALVKQGYTPEQIAHIMRQKYRLEGDNWIDLDPKNDIAQINPSMDQPGDLTLPEEWKNSSWNLKIARVPVNIAILKNGHLYMSEWVVLASVEEMAARAIDRLREDPRIKKANEKYDEARALYGKAQDEYQKLYEEYTRARSRYHNIPLEENRQLAINASDIADKAYEKVKELGNEVRHHNEIIEMPATLFFQLRTIPESYRLFDWALREMLEGNITSENIEDTIRFISTATEILNYLKHKHMPEPQIKAKSFDVGAMEDFVNENFHLISNDESGPGYEGDKLVLWTNEQGWTVRVVPPNDVITEGKEMQNCLGDTSYEWDQKVEAGYSVIISLRDPRNWPHISIELASDYVYDWKNVSTFDHDWKIAQQYGKQNQAPIEKYQKIIDEFWQWVQNNAGPVSQGYQNTDWEDRNNPEPADPEPYHDEDNDDFISGDNINIEDLDDLLWYINDYSNSPWKYVTSEPEVVDGEIDYDYDPPRAYYWYTYEYGATIRIDRRDVEDIVTESMTDLREYIVGNSEEGMEKAQKLAYYLYFAYIHAYWNTEAWTTSAKDLASYVIDIENEYNVGEEENYYPTIERPQSEGLFNDEDYRNTDELRGINFGDQLASYYLKYLIFLCENQTWVSVPDTENQNPPPSHDEQHGDFQNDPRNKGWREIKQPYVGVGQNPFEMTAPRAPEQIRVPQAFSKWVLSGRL